MTRAGAAPASSTRSATAAEGLTIASRPSARPRSAGRTLLLLLVAVVLGVAGVVAYTVYRIDAQGQREERRPADAIVVLGAAQFNGVPGAVVRSAARARGRSVEGGLRAVSRRHRRQAARRPHDGGRDRPAWAIAHGVPAEAILVGGPGPDDARIPRGRRAHLPRQRPPIGVFVSDETHMLRVLRMASDQGIVAWGSPTRTSPTDLDGARRAKATLHELAGLAAYYVGGGQLLDDAATASTP